MKLYFSLFGIATLACWLAWVFIVYTVDPLKAGWFGFLIFYSSLFLALTGALTLIILLGRRKWRPQDLPWTQIIVSLRQSIWLASATTIGLYFLSKNMLRWWNGLLLILVILTIEAILQTKGKPQKYTRIRDINS